MRVFTEALMHAVRWLSRRSAPPALVGSQWAGPSFLDAYRRQRQPTAHELMGELKNTAWACASLNAAVCASHPPVLYVATHDRQPGPKCLTKSLAPAHEDALRGRKHLPARFRKAARIVQVLDHPLLTLLEQVNEFHNAFDLWELTTLYQEVHGCAYWHLTVGPLGLPAEIWPLPPQNVTLLRRENSPNLVDGYLYRVGGREQVFEPREIVAFRYPDPRDPYTAGLAPLRACFEQVALTSDYTAMKKAIYDNRGLPSAIVSPEQAISADERDAYEIQWNQKFRRGGAGKILVADTKMRVDLLQQSMGDLAQLAEIRATMEDICNAFHVPISYMTTSTNLANLQAAERQHLKNAIHPRLARRDQKINEQLIPWYDPTGRLFVASEDPSPADVETDLKKLELQMKYGITTINEVRSAQGLPPVPWGDAAWLPQDLAPVRAATRS